LGKPTAAYAIHNAEIRHATRIGCCRGLAMDSSDFERYPRAQATLAAIADKTCLFNASSSGNSHCDQVTVDEIAIDQEAVLLHIIQLGCVLVYRIGADLMVVLTQIIIHTFCLGIELWPNATAWSVCSPVQAFSLTFKGVNTNLWMTELPYSNGFVGAERSNNGGC
jgi:hypothetical protein